MRKNNRKRVDFDAGLTRGPRSYEAAVADWWIRRSHDRAHMRAYAKIAAFMKEAMRDHQMLSPNWIVDYATGNGAFLPFLLREFPSASVIALDGSLRMLKAAKAELLRSAELKPAKLKPAQLKPAAEFDARFVSPRSAFRKAGPAVRLVKTPLPNSTLPNGRADVVVFLFPNLVASKRDRHEIYRRKAHNSIDSSVARLLATMAEDGDKPLSKKKADEEFEDLLHARLIAENTRRLLKEGALWFKVDYSSIPRDQLSELSQWKTLFGECAMEAVIAGHKFSEPFKYVTSRYFRSSVIEDVYEQTKNPEDKVGGFFVSLLQAQ